MRCANHVLDNLKARQDDSASKTWDIKDLGSYYKR